MIIERFRSLPSLLNYDRLGYGFIFCFLLHFDGYLNAVLPTPLLETFPNEQGRQKKNARTTKLPNVCHYNHTENLFAETRNKLAYC